MTQVFDAGIAVRKDRGDNAADEFLEGVAPAEAERNEVVAVDGPRERRRITRWGAGVLEGGEEAAVDWAGGVEGGEYLLLEEEGLIYTPTTKHRFPGGGTMICVVEPYSSSLTSLSASSSTLFLFLSVRVSRSRSR